MSEERRRTLSASQIDNAGCRLRWYWSYPVGYQPVDKSPALLFGDGIHRALEAYYEKGRDPVEVFQLWAEKEDAEIDVELGVAMLEGYLEEYGEEEEFTVLEVDGKKQVEQTVRIPITDPWEGEDTGCDLVVRFDGLVRDHDTAQVFSLEHKTYRQQPTQTELDLNHQFTAQVVAGQQLLSELGIDEVVEGVLYNGLRKQAPGPRVKSPLFYRQKLYRWSTQVRELMVEAFYTDMTLHHLNIPVFAQPEQFRCKMCDFKEPCLERLRGGDYQSLLELSYVSREQRQGQKRRSK